MKPVAAAAAGKLLPEADLVDVATLRAAYFEQTPDPTAPEQSVRFGTSGHRGTSFAATFNEWHVLAIAQAICDFRREREIGGPLFVGIDTHALSQPAFESALEVLAANGVRTMVSANGEFTPTPAVSHAILAWNRGAGRGEGSSAAGGIRSGAACADGIVVTPSHNPPEDGGFKYNPPDGGPADTSITGWIERRANDYLRRRLDGVRRMPFERARAAPTTCEYDYVSAYVADLGSVIDFDVIRSAGIRLAVDPLGGAGVHYWAPIAERYGIPLEVLSEEVDFRFAFMTADHDGRIRMDPSSRWAMQRLIGLKDRYDVAFACDTDHDRHGIVAASVGLMPSNHYLSVLAHELFRSRTGWPPGAALGKTVVTTTMLDRVAAKLGRRVVEVPVGFKWFVDGLLDAALGFAGEESAGASVLRRDGTVWTTDKDGIVLALLSAEISARRGRDPGELYRALEEECGHVSSARVDAPADAAQRKALGSLRAQRLELDTLAGEPVREVLDRAPGNGEPIGGVKVVSANGWFAARPSGTEDVYKIYAESWLGDEHLQRILSEAQAIVDRALDGVGAAPGTNAGPR